MSDRELLKDAAKAAGLSLSNCDDSVWDEERADFVGWNPLTDDGDALRLAVKLGMCVDTDWNGGANAGNANIDFSDPEYGYQEGQGKNDPYAATRRAIVRAAAEIGRAIP